MARRSEAKRRSRFYRDLKAYHQHPTSGTCSDLGCDNRDAFRGLMNTRAKQRISFWNYLGDRLTVPGAVRVPL
jgi:hypothetical protein